MSKPFDATLKEMLELSPDDWVRVMGYEGHVLEIVDTDVSTITGATDKAMRVRSKDGEWLLDLNFQSGPDASVPRRAHLYNTLLEERHGLPVRSVVVLLSPKANLSTINGVFERGFPGEEPYDVFKYKVVRTWELPVEPLLKGGLGLLPLAPISAVREEQLPGVIEQIRQRLTAPDAPPDAKDLWSAVYILMGLRYQRDIVNKLLKGVREMEESDTYQAIIEKGVVKGRVEGERKGAIEQMRKVVLRSGRKQFGEPSAEILAEIQAADSLDYLEKLDERCDEVNSWEELVSIPTKGKRRRKKSE